MYGVLSKGIPPPPPVLVQQHAPVPEQPENMYIDQSYNYAPEYQQNSQDHGYVEGWPITNVQPNPVV